MQSKFSFTVDPEMPRSEYPRPQLVRNSYLCLNGPWDLAGAATGSAPKQFAGEVLVPFPPESELSGVQREKPKGYSLWYRKNFSIPKERSARRVLLHFDAVDQNATLWCNGALCATHEGGYSAFTAEITEYLQENNTLLLRVEDETERGTGMFGSQALKTAWSGIWQTVWCECVPGEYIESVDYDPSPALGTVQITVHTFGGEGKDLPCYVSLMGNQYEIPTDEPVELPVPDAPLWTPEEPVLIPLRLSYGEDRVKSYFAMRSFSIGRSETGNPVFLLNGIPRFLHGVVYDSTWPDGLCTAPSEEAMLYDLQQAKTMGFDAIRLTDKIECARFYHLCARLGLMVWQGIPSGGSPKAPAIPLKDGDYAAYGRKKEESRSAHYKQLGEVIKQLRSFPAVVAWELFDERRGMFDTEHISRYVDELDGTRPVDRVSGYDTGFDPIVSLHSYGRAFHYKADKDHRPVILSACGGFGHVAQGMKKGDAKAASFESPQQLLAALEDLYNDSILPAASDGLAGAFYYSLVDSAGGSTGLITFDRKLLKLSPRFVRSLFSRP